MFSELELYNLSLDYLGRLHLSFDLSLSSLPQYFTHLTSRVHIFIDSSSCSESQREAALLIGQFAATDSECKVNLIMCIANFHSDGSIKCLILLYSIYSY